MAQFTSSPALQVRGIDMAAVERQRQGRQSTGTRNALYEAKTQELRGAQGQRDTEAAQARKQRGLELGVRLLETVALYPESTRERGFQEAKKIWAANGYSTESLPETLASAPGFLENTLPLMRAEAGKVTGKSFTLSPGQQRFGPGGKEIASLPAAPTESFETVKNPLGLGGVGQQSTTSGKLSSYQAPGGGSNTLTALQKDVPYIAKLLGIGMKEALALKMESKSKGYDAYVRDITARYVSFGENPERAVEKAKTVADLLYGRTPPPPEAAPDSKEGRDYLKEFFGFFGGGDDAGSAKAKTPAKPNAGRKSRSAKSAKKGSWESPHMPKTDADFDSIKSGEIYVDPDDNQFYRKP